MISSIFNNILNRPIGAVTKNYDFMEESLMRNIGNGVHFFDGYGTSIGSLADTKLNQKTVPWFIWNKEKNNYANYLEYVNGTYFKESSLLTNFGTSDGHALSFKNTSSLENYNSVGVVRNYDVNNTADTLVSTGKVNPNGGDGDTRLGVINNFYLGETLTKSIKKTESLEKVFSITNGLYDKFSLMGEFGINEGVFKNHNGMVTSQKELIGDIIPWSTTDHWYDSTVVGGGGSGNIETVRKLTGYNGDGLSVDFKDISQGVNNGNLYGGYGNFYSITYSLGLIGSAGEKTKNFIARSMYGYDLLDQKYDNVGFDYEKGDATNDGTNHSYLTGKKYYVGHGTRGTNYIDKLTGIDVDYVTEVLNVGGKKTEVPIRMRLIDAGNDNLWSTKALYSYAEAENGGAPTTLDTITSYNNGVAYGRVLAYSDINVGEKKDIINYTNERFKNGKYDTLIARFHTQKFGSPQEARGNRDITQTAISEFGMSHGRNLLKKDKHNEGEGYDNPYCRVWTYHHQYNTIKDLIRPFDEVGNVENSVLIGSTRGANSNLVEYGVKGKNGLVRFAPTKKDDIKLCMFSIENLAWKGSRVDKTNINIGTNGGRIMWFPPYDLKFNETVGVNWNSNSFIGRGENIYTYTNTERSGSLSFKLLIDHPMVLNSFRGSTNNEISDVDDVESTEQTILRFFAGCDSLSQKMQDKSSNAEKNEVKTEPKPKDVELPTATYDEINFYVFFPNNYSGLNDSAEGTVKPMWYLVNGVGTQKRSDGSDVPTTLKATYLGDCNDGESLFGIGYEMVTSYGISGSDKAGSTSDPTTSKDVFAPLKGVDKNGKTIYWHYRVDHRSTSVKAEMLDKEVYPIVDNYLDKNSYNLNSIGYETLLDYHTDAKPLKDNDTLYSFLDVFTALEGEEEFATCPLRLNYFINFNRVEKIRSLLECDIESIQIVGYASSQGHKESNIKLARDRSQSVRAWLKRFDVFKSLGDKITTESTTDVPKSNPSDNNLLDAKIWRCVSVKIKVSKEEVSPMSENRNDLTNINVMGTKTFGDVLDARDIVEKNKKIITTSDLISDFDKRHKELTNVQVVGTVNQRENNRALADEEHHEAELNGSFKPKSLKGDIATEYEYFTELERTDPFLHNKICEKIKYFDPAFHSITPEGFNARLTFLHQCTRQGSTMSMSDNGAKSAGNLAFGMPPVCILRIGDFYNTKIIIDNVSIDYDNASWDLNDEGIGVMPMMANITLSFKFLGGSDLSGPIKRLQNAVSFNYYANTSVYSDRADINKYKK